MKTYQFDWHSPTHFFSRAEQAVKAAEESHKSGSTKREIAINLLVDYLPAPFWLPKFIKRIICGLIVDGFIYIYNRYWSKDWYNQKPKKVEHQVEI